MAPCKAQQKFAPGCSNPAYPSPAPKKAPAIDGQCGLSGSDSDETTQNEAKNNFCASGAPEAMTIPDFAQLQSLVMQDPTINFGDEDSNGRKKGPAVNRAPLRKLGEGKLVALKAYVLFAHQERSESVNCGNDVPDQAAFHDIHVELVASPTTTDECSGIVSEMIPHHRPDSWTAGNVQKVADAKLMVRVTGQLFFDSSHFSCQSGEGVRDNPKRASLWEIHPIYKFEVCRGNCTTDGQWLTLDQWIKLPVRSRGSKAGVATSQR
jgi:hypothetical protein